MIIDIEELVPNGITNGIYDNGNGDDPYTDNELRFDETDFYFLENGREILVIIEPERYDVSDCTWNGLKTLLFIRWFYFYKEVDMSFKAFCNTMLDDWENVEMFSYLTQGDVDSIWDALFNAKGIPTKWYYDIITFFLNYWYDIKRWFYGLQEKYTAWWDKYVDWEKTIYLDLGAFGKYKLFTISAEGIAWVFGGILIFILITLLGYLGFQFTKSYAIEKGKIKARD